ncbi:MAG: ABC transporter [Microbacterium sp. SCN 70-200]|uniref:ABC transporter permease n=1 Tax=unclassified Microbacterium TaxID=2609290 RepID=UPI00086887ED|nr:MULTISPECIES: ABC transporter permease [unclassified Microbacterium]MBN9216213.1 ABC transporter permease [Microbacterium sp.]ODT41803.1 MAG: ABC transporter [Microbacterium sp. SCN 70-200]OJV84492.1 MAG: ABC transporter permease [Microbacterium sp. 70-16]
MSNALAAAPRISPTMLRVEAMRQLRNPYTLAFTLGMPVAMYLLFGAGMGYGSQSAGHGNVSFYVMVSMAAYGTTVAMSSITSLAATEAKQGWGRQLAMTPLGTIGYAATKLITAVSFAALAVAAVFVAGLITGAEAEDAWRWFACAGIILGVGLMFGLYGLGVGLFFNSDTAAALASISLTFFAFFGNVFIPLDGTMLDIARFTPMYGYVALSRWPLNDGLLTTGQTESLWVVLLNIVAWVVVFSVLVAAGVKRSRSRR